MGKDGGRKREVKDASRSEAVCRVDDMKQNVQEVLSTPMVCLAWLAQWIQGGDG